MALASACHSVGTAHLSQRRIIPPSLNRSSRKLSRVVVRAASATEVEAPKVNKDALVEMLKTASKTPGSVNPKDILSAMLTLEKLKIPAEGWEDILKAPGKRWKLIFTSSSADVAAASKGQKVKGGQYFPLTAVQKFENGVFTNGVFLGTVAHLNFPGPYSMTKRQLYFDVTKMGLGLGPWSITIPLKNDDLPLSERDSKEVKKLPFFLYIYIDDELIVGRGRGGGLAMWSATDKEWEAKAGVLQVYK